MTEQTVQEQVQIDPGEHVGMTAVHLYEPRGRIAYRLAVRSDEPRRQIHPVREHAHRRSEEGHAHKELRPGLVKQRLSGRLQFRPAFHAVFSPFRA